MKPTKITKKINHDSMWMKFFYPNGHVRLGISRSRDSVSFSDGLKDQAVEIWERFKVLHKQEKTFNDVFVKLESEYSN